MGQSRRVRRTGIEGRAENGEAEAQYSLGLMYSTGQRVDQNYVTAHKWFNLAAHSGSELARLEREELSAIMSTDEIAEAQRRAREWKLAH